MINFHFFRKTKMTYRLKRERKLSHLRVHPKKPNENKAAARMANDDAHAHPAGVHHPAAVVVVAREAKAAGPGVAVKVQSAADPILWREDALSDRDVMRSEINAMKSEPRSEKSAIKRANQPAAGVEMIRGKRRGRQNAKEIDPPPLRNPNPQRPHATPKPPKLMQTMKP